MLLNFCEMTVHYGGRRGPLDENSKTEIANSEIFEYDVTKNHVMYIRYYAHACACNI